MTYTYIIPQVNTDKNHIQVGATNLLIKLTVKSGNSALDISDATTKNIIIERPDSTLVTGSGIFFTDGTDGILYYRTIVTDLNQDGEYNAQAYLVTPSFTGYTTQISFTVYENLPLTDAC